MVQIKIMQNLDVRVSYDPAWTLKMTPGMMVGKKGGK